MVTWAYGVTTIPLRRRSLLTRTLESLKGAGFPSPRLFVDDCKNSEGVSYEQEFGLEVTCHYPAMRTYGNWITSLAALYIRQPTVDLYAMFQDDFVTYKNLRQYLEKVINTNRLTLQPFYYNCLTFPANQERCPKEDGKEVVGWFQSNQMGRGAVALVFNRDTVVRLLSSQHMVDRPMDAHRGHKSVDGGVVTALTKIGYREMVHNPSLVQHTGLKSSMGNRQHPLAPSFRGEDFDALELLR